MTDLTNFPSWNDLSNTRKKQNGSALSVIIGGPASFLSALIWGIVLLLLLPGCESLTGVAAESAKQECIAVRNSTKPDFVVFSETGYGNRKKTPFGRESTHWVQLMYEDPDRAEVDLTIEIVAVSGEFMGSDTKEIEFDSDQLACEKFVVHGDEEDGFEVN